MRDFTLKQYKEFLEAIPKDRYSFQSFENFINSPKEMSIVLRHDVDKLPQNSLLFAKLQNNMNIIGTYYFRIVPQSFHEKIIKDIYNLGHEIGYHYETMDTCKGDIDKAYDLFCDNLETFRKFAPISTICMHGSPMSKFDNRDIWKKYDYKNLGITAEPYIDLDFNKTFYLTDTGRRWDGDKVSIRDKSISSNPVNNIEFLKYSFNSTSEIINAISENNFPQHVMFTFHPQRWTDSNINWIKELIIQNAKNQIKKIIVKSLS